MTDQAVPTLGRDSHPFRVVLTGGPGGGKSTAADLLRREIGERVIVVPEAATMLFAGGFPATGRSPGASQARRPRSTTCNATSRTSRPPSTPNGSCCAIEAPSTAAPTGRTVPTTSTRASAARTSRSSLRYDAVIFFETAALGSHGFESENPVRTETQQEAVELDGRLRELWAPHPWFTVIPHSASFFRKMTVGLGILESLIAQIEGSTDPS